MPTITPGFEEHRWIVNELLDWLDGGPEPATVPRDNLQTTAMVFAAIEASRRASVIDVADVARGVLA